MWRNIGTLFNFEPPATEAEIRDASPRYREIEAEKARARSAQRFAMPRSSRP